MENMLERIRTYSIATITIVFMVCLAGCLSQGRQKGIWKTADELAIQLKTENPESFAPTGTICDQGEKGLLGEWEGYEICISQVRTVHGINARKYASRTEYQFFDDGTYCRVYKSSGVSAVFHGTWSYSNGEVSFHEFNDNVLQRTPSMKIVWHDADIIEMRCDLDELQGMMITEFPGKVHSSEARYDEDGFHVQEDDLEYANDRFSGISVMSPHVFRKVGDTHDIKMVEHLQNPTIRTDALEAEQELGKIKAAIQEENSRADIGVASAIVSGMAAVATALSHEPVVQPQPSAQPQPIVVQSPAVQQSSATRTHQSVPMTSFKPYQKVTRPSSFFVGENADGTPKVSDQSWRDGRYR